jgi:ATP-dependent RNA helicase DDX24/MAK5
LRAAGDIVLGDDVLGPPLAVDDGAAAAAARPAKRSKKGAAKEAAAPDEVEALKAQLQSLKAENKKLKRKQQAGGGEAPAAPEPPSNDSKKKKEPKDKSKAAALVEAVEEAPLADVSAWADYQLHPSITGALARLGFSAPTHIQAECLPAAVRDRRDIIGAAQTVRAEHAWDWACAALPLAAHIRLPCCRRGPHRPPAHACVPSRRPPCPFFSFLQGSGKTLAFGLPILQLLMQEQQAAAAAAAAAAGPDAPPPPPSPLRALVLAPTRELALQVTDHLSAVGRPCGIWVVPIVGGLSHQKQERLLARAPAVVVATPGRLWELMRDGQRHVADLSHLSFLVVDEADRMVQQGHYSELASILDQIPRAPGTADAAADEDAADEDVPAGGEAGAAPPARAGPPMQTFVFSATLTLPSDLRKRLRKGGGGSSASSSLDALMDRLPFRGRGRPKIADLTSRRRVADGCEEAVLSCPEAERDEYLYCLLAAHPGRTIVFVNAVSSVRRLAAILKLLGLPAAPLHAQMQQRQRLKALDRFKADPNGLLVATDVAARGLDVKNVACVVHYQLPASVDVYVHRSGRTGRARAEGVAIAMVTPKEAGRYQALLRALDREEPPEFPVDESLMPGARRRVRLAVRLDELERGVSKERAERSWRQSQAQEIGVLLSDDSGGEGGEGAVAGRRVGKKARKSKRQEGGGGGAPSADSLRAELGALLAAPLQPKFSARYFTGGAAAGVAAAAAARGPGGGDAPAAPSSASTVSQAVALAQRTSDSRAAAAAAAGGAGKKGGGGKAKQRAAVDPRAAALANALRKRAAKKANRSPMFVVPRALGRETQGPNALEVLRRRRGAPAPAAR